MKNIIKSKYIISALAFILTAFIIMLNVNKFSGEATDESVPHQTDKDSYFYNNHSTIDESQNGNNGTEINFFGITSPELNNDNEKKKDLDKTYINNPKNLKMKELIEKAVKNVEGLPQYVWEPVRFNENDINEHIAKLEKIIMYSARVKSKNDAIDDKRILSELISGEIKDKIEHFKLMCTDVRRASVARNDDDQKFIDDSFRDCDEKIKELENKLNYYETEY